MSEKLVRNYSDEVSKRWWESVEKSCSAPKLTASQEDINQTRCSAGIERLSPSESGELQSEEE